MTLPPLLPFSGNLFDWDQYIESVYQEFINGFVQPRWHFLGKPITARRNPAYKGKHHGFWHIVSEQGTVPGEDERLPNLERCERIRWVGYVLSISSDQEKILCWRNSRTSSRGTSNRLLLYLKDSRYLVVLEEKPEFLMLVTAYLVSHEHTHLKLIKEHSNSKDPRL